MKESAKKITEVCLQEKKNEQCIKESRPFYKRPMKKIAFICVHNSCRSQIAEALGKHFASDVFESYSAGTETLAESLTIIGDLKTLQESRMKNLR